MKLNLKIEYLGKKERKGDGARPSKCRATAKKKEKKRATDLNFANPPSNVVLHIILLQN